jgi:3-hydroxyacyl-[acyl-carrier-protein] dehydratase
MNREAIKELLPHREPMLLVDEMEMIDGKAHGRYHVKGDEFFLQGHFPGNPVVPGVILCEIMAQSCTLLLGDAIKGKTPYYTGINNVKFKNPVHPGDTVHVVAEVLSHKGVFYFTRCEAKNQHGKLVCVGDTSFAILDERK